MMDDLTKREYVALQILNGACSGDWKFDLPNGISWGTAASLRAFELADDFLKVSEGKKVKSVRAKV